MAKSKKAVRATPALIAALSAGTELESLKQSTGTPAAILDALDALDAGRPVDKQAIAQLEGLKQSTSTPDAVLDAMLALAAGSVDSSSSKRLVAALEAARTTNTPSAILETLIALLKE